MKNQADTVGMQTKWTREDLPFLQARLGTLHAMEGASTSSYPQHSNEIARLDLIVRLLEAGVPFIEPDNGGLKLSDRIIVAIHTKKWRWVKFTKGNGGWKFYRDFDWVVEYGGGLCRGPERRKAPDQPRPDAGRASPSHLRESYDQTAHASRAVKQQPSYKSVLAKITDEAHKLAKRLSVDEDTPLGDLLVEGLNHVFRARGLPEIAMKVVPDETGKPRR